MGTLREVIWITEESSCSYKPEKLQRIFAVHSKKQGVSKKEIDSEFVPQGLLASRHAAIGLDCPSCNSCVALRIRTSDYNFSKNDKAIFKHNKDLKFSFKPEGNPLRLTREHFDLFRLHSKIRHPGQGMENWYPQTVDEYLEGHSGLMEVRSNGGKLMAAAVYDHLDGALNAYYIVFDPNESTNKSSLGTLCFLKLIEKAKEDGLEHLYIGHWVSGNRKLAYKQRFQNIEALTDQGWTPFNSNIHVVGTDHKRAIPADADSITVPKP